RRRAGRGSRVGAQADHGRGHRSGAQASQRSRPSRGLPHLLPPPRLQLAGADRLRRARVPQRGDRLRGLQEAAAGKPGAGARETPRGARRARSQPRPHRRAGAARHAQGGRRGGRDHVAGARRGEAGLMAESTAENGAFAVALPHFEGPLDLLLTLIQEHKLEIFDIPISFITDRYLEYVDAARALNIDLAGEYLLMAATLAHIKS